MVELGLTLNDEVQKSRGVAATSHCSFAIRGAMGVVDDTLASWSLPVEILWA